MNGYGAAMASLRMRRKATTRTASVDELQRSSSSLRKPLLTLFMDARKRTPLSSCFRMKPIMLVLVIWFKKSSVLVKNDFTRGIIFRH